MAIVRIESDADERLSDFRNIPDPDLLVRRGLFVAEGRMVVTRLLASGLETRALLVTDTALVSLGESIANAVAPVYVVPQAVMNSAAGFNFHRGVLACGERKPCPALEEVVGHAERSTIVVCPTLNNPENLGTIIRIADVFGIDAVCRYSETDGCRAVPNHRRKWVAHHLRPSRRKNRTGKGP